MRTSSHQLQLGDNLGQPRPTCYPGDELVVFMAVSLEL